MPKTIKVKVYKFNELPKEIQDKVIEHMGDINTDYDWWDSVYEDAKEIGKLIGIDIEHIWFSGFSSQGDGAQFEGRYNYNKGSVKALKECAPLDKELHRIAESLYRLQRPNFYRLTATVKHYGQYNHKYCTKIYVEDEQGYNLNIKESDESKLTELLRDFMDWIYKTLKAEYEYLISPEQITATIEANEYTFLENGDRADCLIK